MTSEQKQSVFNTVVTHLLTQKAHATDPKKGCVYRTPEGLKCAVGCLIKPECYDQAFEGYTADSLMVKPAVESSLGFEVDTGFLCKLQTIHDDNPPERWHQRLQSFAFAHHLNFNPPNE